MKFYEDGNLNLPVILLIPGTACHWTIFSQVIPLFKPWFHTVAVSFDGFDETDDTIYLGMIQEVEKIESYVRERFRGKICCTYGCSLGGSFAAELAARKIIHIDHVIIGSSDMDQMSGFPAWISTKLVVYFIAEMMAGNGRTWWLDWFMKRIKKKEPERAEKMETFLNSFLDAPYTRTVKKESLFNQFYSDLVTKLPAQIDVQGTQIHVFYALDMGKKYEKRYLHYFAHPDIRKQNMNHETFFFFCPKEWTEEVLDCCGIRSAVPFWDRPGPEKSANL